MTAWDFNRGPMHFYVISGKFGNNSVRRYHGETGKFIDIFVPDGSGGLKAPVGLAFGPDSHLLSPV